jgi:two-component system response regulator LytT
MKSSDEDPLPERAQRLAVRKRGRIELVPISHVLFVRGADNHVELVLRDGRRELYDSTLAGIGAILLADFVRIHKSYLVRLSAVQRIQVRGGSQYTVELTGGALLPVGRTRYKAIRAKLLSA